MEVSLTSQMEAFVEESIASGLFGSPGELVHVALHELQSRQQNEEQAMTELRHAVDLGLKQLDAGLVVPLDIEAIKAKARRLNGIDQD